MIYPFMGENYDGKPFVGDGIRRARHREWEAASRRSGSHRYALQVHAYIPPSIVLSVVLQQMCYVYAKYTSVIITGVNLQL